MKSNYDGFRGWLNYIRDYKENKDLFGDDLVENELREEIAKLKANSQEKDKLLALRNNRIDALGEELINERKRCNELRSNLQSYGKEVDKLKEKLEKTEKARRKNAGAIGGLKAKINELTHELEKENHRINFLENSKHAPSKEEVLAYEKAMKEVEKRQKNK